VQRFRTPPPQIRANSRPKAERELVALRRRPGILIPSVLNLRSTRAARSHRSPRTKEPLDALLDLVIANATAPGICFLMSEDDVRLAMQQLGGGGHRLRHINNVGPLGESKSLAPPESSPAS
jgi:hypothetical protein